MEFIVISLIFLALLLLIVWRPFFKQSKQAEPSSSNLRDETNIRLYHEHKKEIEKDYGEGGIDEESYQYLLAELDKTLLQDIEQQHVDNEVITEAITANDGSAKKSFSVLWPISLSVFIIAFSVALYDKQGSYQQIVNVKQMPENHAQQQQMGAEEAQKQRQQEALAYIEQLKQQTVANPDDSETWYNLGQTLVMMGGFDGAINAFEQVIRIEGEQAELLGAIAQASYYRNNQQIDAEIQTLIDRSLALDRNDPSTNILLGMHNFIEENYQVAITHWQRVIDAGKQGVNITALQEAVTEATNRLGNSQSNTQEKSPTGMQAQTQTEAASQSGSSGPQLKVKVSLSDEIAQLLAKGEDRVVFVYAIPTTGKRMPLAAVKIMASDLPTVVVLNNSQAMTAQNNLSSVDQVHLFAIASKLGGVGIKSGDYRAEIKNIAVNNTETVNLLVDSIVE
jgi:cytochrome c-type biogenesis protein CcmH